MMIKKIIFLLFITATLNAWDSVPVYNPDINQTLSYIVGNDWDYLRQVLSNEQIDKIFNMNLTNIGWVRTYWPSNYLTSAMNALKVTYAFAMYSHNGRVYFELIKKENNRWYIAKYSVPDLPDAFRTNQSGKGHAKVPDNNF